MELNHDDMNWRTLSSEYLFNRPWLTVRRDKVQLPDGTENPEFYILEYPDWVNVIAITDDDRFVLVRQYRHGIAETRYELCAGVIEPGETPEQGARREFAEETGFGGGDWEEIMTISGNASTTNNLTHCFVARGVKQLGEQHLDRTEDIRVATFTRDEIFDMLRNGEFRQALMVAPLWKFFYDTSKS